MEISTAHIFYIPIIFAVGLLAGYFLGRHAVETEIEERKKKQKRREALEERARKESRDHEETK